MLLADLNSSEEMRQRRNGSSLEEIGLHRGYKSISAKFARILSRRCGDRLSLEQPRPVPAALVSLGLARL
jgi:hypothetical protein